MTTFAGLTPMLTELGVSAQFLIPMATSLGFGVLFGSAISLVLVPSLYLISEDVRARLTRPHKQLVPAVEELVPHEPDVEIGGRG